MVKGYDSVAVALSANVAGEVLKCQIRHLDGTQDRRQGVRAAGGHCRGEVEDGDDDICVHHDLRLPAAAATLTFLQPHSAVVKDRFPDLFMNADMKIAP